jgi:hypothetical protein
MKLAVLGWDGTNLIQVQPEKAQLNQEGELRFLGLSSFSCVVSIPCRMECSGKREALVQLGAFVTRR